MKPLDKMFNDQKAELLFQLFPEEVPGILDFILSMCETLEEDQERIAKNWDNPLFTFGSWLSFGRALKANILEQGRKMKNSKKHFSGLAFDGYLGLFSIHCLSEYVRTREHDNKRFTALVTLLFNP